MQGIGTLHLPFDRSALLVVRHQSVPIESLRYEGQTPLLMRSKEYPANEYEADLVEELRVQFPEAEIITIGAEQDLSINSVGSAVWDSVLSVIPAQLASVIWSGKLGLNIDDPFVGQSTLTRVVSSVQLHPIEPAE